MRAGTDDPPRERVEEAEAALEARSPGYLADVRASADRLGLADLDGTDAGAALIAVEDLALIDLDVPTFSNQRLGRYAKRTIKRLIAWYLGYVGRQVTALGYAVAHLGTVLVGRTAQLEGKLDTVSAEVSDLTRRVDALEAGGTQKQ
jgi:hypothetical protein